MSPTCKPKSAPTEPKASVGIRTLQPIMFYSGKNDELHIHLAELDTGEVIIQSLSEEMMQIKEVTLLDNGEKLTWKQDLKGLKVAVPQSINEEFGKEHPVIINIKF